MLPDVEYFAARIKSLPGRLGPLPSAASRPIAHFELGLSDAWALNEYVRRNVERKGRHRRAAEVNQQRLRTLIFIAMVETFERFVKEVAALCVDSLASYVTDDRFRELRVDSRSLAAHFSAGTLGRALTEGATWLDTDEINKRMRRLLADRRVAGAFELFPAQGGDAWRGETLDVLFQLRHGVVHNAGVITSFDATKLSALTGVPSRGAGQFVLERGDLWYVRRFLGDLARWVNDAVGGRLAAVLTAIHHDAPAAFDAAQKATELVEKLDRQTTIDGVTRP